MSINSVDENTGKVEVKVSDPMKVYTDMGDPVNHPSHYNKGSIEVIDLVEDRRLGFSLGNAVKYICRADGKGNEIQDLQKAAWYLKRVEDSPLADPYLIPYGNIDLYVFLNEQNLPQALQQAIMNICDVDTQINKIEHIKGARRLVEHYVNLKKEAINTSD